MVSVATHTGAVYRCAAVVVATSVLPHVDPSPATLRAVGLGDWVAGLPDGLGTVLAAVGAERGESFSWDVDFGRPVPLPSTVSVRVAHPERDDATSSGKGGRLAPFELAVWDPRSGKPHLTGTLTPFG